VSWKGIGRKSLEVEEKLREDLEVEEVLGEDLK
jgi:hypothetical protein